MFRNNLRRKFHGQSSRGVCLVDLHRLLGLLEYYGKTLIVSLAAPSSVKAGSSSLIAFLTVLFPRCILLEVCLTLFCIFLNSPARA